MSTLRLFLTALISPLAVHGHAAVHVQLPGARRRLAAVHAGAYRPPESRLRGRATGGVSGADPPAAG